MTGPKGVGKSTLAAMMSENEAIPNPIEILSFATPLKRMAASILPPEAFTPEGKEDPKFGICGKTPRHILQTLGTDWGRMMVGSNIWVEAMRNRILASDAPVVIIDDLRFENEWALVKELGGIVIRLERKGIAYTGEHASEQPIPPHMIDCVLDLDRVHPNHLSTIFNPFL